MKTLKTVFVWGNKKMNPSLLSWGDYQNLTVTEMAVALAPARQSWIYEAEAHPLQIIQ